MNNKHHFQDTKELVMSVILLVILLCVINPGHFWMPDMLAMTLSALLLALFALFATFVWREKAADEREHFHKLLVGRMAFLIGAGVLSLALLVQSIEHTTDPWIAIALGAMILTKLVGIMWVRKKQ